MTTAHRRMEQHSAVSALDPTVYQAALKMKEQGLRDAFIISALRLSLEYDGIADLFYLWQNAETPEQRDSVIADIQDHIDDSGESPGRLPKVRYKELEGIAAEIMDFKSTLRERVEKWGGITKLARATGIPQPSLSRFFSSGSMPRRTTLYRIADAMDLSETEIRTPWLR